MAKYTKTKIACYTGYFVQAIIVGFLPLLFVSFNRDYGISFEKLGALAVFIFVVQLGVDLLSVKFLKYIGYRGGALLAHVTASAGFIMLAFLPEIMADKYLAVVLSSIVFSVGGGLVEVIISPIIEYLPVREENKAAQMSLLHSFFCWGTVITIFLTTVLLGVLGRENWRYISLLWAAVSAVNIILFSFVPIVEPSEREQQKAQKEILRSPVFYAIMLLMLSAGAAEISVSQWASTFAETGLRLSKTTGDLLGPGIFAVLMGAGRLLFGIYGTRLKIERVMLLSGLLCFTSYILIFLNINAVVSLAACALCGLSVSIMWPGALSLGAKKFPLGGTLLFGAAAAFGDTGCSVGPYLMGVMTERGSMPLGFLVCSIFPLLIIALSLYFARIKK